MVGPGATKHEGALGFYNRLNLPTFPPKVIRRLYNLQQKLMMYGIVDIMICGERIEFGSGSQKFTIKSSSTSHFGNVMNFPQYCNKKTIIAIYATIILLLEIGYIKDLFIGNYQGIIEPEYEELWQTAWSILINMKEV